MNTVEFLEGYKEIKKPIENNLADFRQAYDVPDTYEYNRFFIEWMDEVHIELLNLLPKASMNLSLTR